MTAAGPRRFPGRGKLARTPVVDICRPAFYARSMPVSAKTTICAAPLLGLFLYLSSAMAAESTTPAIREQIQGTWHINDELSQNTDDQVEVAIKAAGGSIPRRLFSRRPEDFYRGGPPEHELYDRLSYDDVLVISYVEPEFRFTYEDDYHRVFYTDGRTRSTGVNDYFRAGGADYSFASWDGDSLLVEGRPRDGGFTEETYTVEENGERLRVELLIQPDNFGAPISLVRVFDRVP